MPRRRVRRPGFSLVELVLVIVILGIIGAIAVPRLSNAGRGAAQNALAANLSIVTKAVELYRAEHGGQVPTTSEQLTMSSNAAGATNAVRSAAHPFGPYLYRMPELTMGTHKGKSDLTDAGTPGSDTDAGWWIDNTTGDVRANLPDGDKTDDGVIINTLKTGDFGIKH